DRTMWETLSARLAFIHDYLVDESERPRFEAWVRELLAPAAKELGWTAAPDESADRRAVRGDIMDTLAYSGHDPEVIAKAKGLAEQAMQKPGSVDPDLVTMAINAAAHNGDAALYDQYLAKMKTANDPNEYYLYSEGLRQFRHPELVKRNLEMALTPEVRPQDATGFLGRMLGDPYTQTQAWEFLKAHWKELEPKLLAAYTPGEIVRTTGNFCTTQLRDDAKQFFSGQQLPAVQHSLRQAEEQSNACIDFKTQQQGVLRAWLDQNSGSARAATVQ
ncbi:MAG TPA: ERAP1-like C-terminal domain-containing protein, partial [Terriglobales bacterium]|nr:ERAP1-like C-terminal domain-containing protein [Terriglobales bacterium]